MNKVEDFWFCIGQVLGLIDDKEVIDDLNSIGVDYVVLKNRIKDVVRKSYEARE